MPRPSHVRIDLWLRLEDGLAGQWNVGAWSVSGEPLVLNATILPFPLEPERALAEALSWFERYRGLRGIQLELGLAPADGVSAERELPTA